MNAEQLTQSGATPTPRVSRNGWKMKAALWGGVGVAILTAMGGMSVAIFAHMRDQRAEAFIGDRTFHVLPNCPRSAIGLTAIPKQCADPRYQIVDRYTELNLPRDKQHVYWLRVGLDAAHVKSCDDKLCYIDQVIQDRFPTDKIEG